MLRHIERVTRLWICAMALVRSDARLAQIAALSILLLVNFSWVDFGARPLPSALAILATLATQTICARLTDGAMDLRSPLITGLSLALLLRADAPWLHGLAGVIAIAAKFLIRYDGKHLWNPAAFAIVTLLATTDRVWVSPGQWGSTVWLAALAAGLALVVLGPARRADVASGFLAAYAALLLLRAIRLGDPLVIPLHQIQSGSLLIFAFFMISDPRTTPDSRAGRLAFAGAVAALAHVLAFSMQLRPALYIALVALSPLVVLLDRTLKGRRFTWGRGPLPE